MAKKNRLYIAFLLLFGVATCAYAETIILTTGARINGTIVFQNEEVVIIRDADGARFQYPRADVKEIVADEVKEEKVEEQEEASIATKKKASILLEFGGGLAAIPNDTIGGAFTVDLLVGSHHLANRHLFVGAGIGYHGMFIGASKYNFLPIQVAVRMPLIEEKHAPVFGVAVGYGVALSKNYLGGLYAGLDFGYRCQLNPKTAIAVVLFAQFQQAKIKATETVEGVPFTNKTGRSLITSGLKVALYF